jgi:hypothetical protein
MFCPLKVNRRFGGIFAFIFRIELAKPALPSAFTLVSRSAYSLALKMEAICSSETSVDFQWTTRRYIPEVFTTYMYNLLQWDCHSHTKWISGNWFSFRTFTELEAKSYKAHVVVKKISVVWDITPWSPLKAKRRFGRTCSFYLQRRISSSCYLLHAGFLIGLIFDTENRGAIFLRYVGCVSTDYTA